MLWRPYNLTSLGSANINSTSTKDSSFGAALIFALVVTVSVSYGYMINGSLRDELMYPTHAAPGSMAMGLVDEKISELFTQLNLVHLLDLYGLDAVRNWDDLL